MTILNTHRNRLAVALTMLGVVAFVSPASGFAQADSPGTGPVDVGACGVYDSQADAQADLDADPSLAPDLDGDGNGIACEGGYAGDDEDDANADEGADDTSDDEAVAALPSTGSGPEMPADNQATQIVGAIALMALAGIAGGFVFRSTNAGR